MDYDVGNWEGGRGQKLVQIANEYSTKKLPTWGRGGVKNPEKLPTLFMNGPLAYFDTNKYILK